MSLMWGGGLFVLAALCSYLATALYLHFAHHARIVDIPDHRSAHSQPTPSGGGVAMVLPALLVACLIDYAGWVDFDRWGLYLPLGGIAILGYLDDRFNLPVILRLLAQVLATVAVLFFLAGSVGEQLAGQHFLVNIAVAALLALYILWTVNLYNFMDGIDGIAVSQALTVLGGALLMVLSKGIVEAHDSILLALVLLGSICGFAVWNWSPARIFMGDTGSLFLGFLIAVASLDTALQGWLSICAWLILMGVFISDASCTLLMRLLKGERIYQAHSSHAYQRAARQFGHQGVTLVMIAINLLWLLPLAWTADQWPEWQFALIVIAYFPLLILYIAITQGLLFFRQL